MPHHGHALADVIGAVAAHAGARALAEGSAFHFRQFAGGIVEAGLDVGKAVDAADDVRGILAQAVENDLQGGFAHLVGLGGNANRTLSCSKRFVPGQKTEAFGLFPQQHRSQIPVPEPDFAVVGYRTGDAEGLQAFANRLRGGSSFAAALLHGNGRTQDISPFGVLKADGLDVGANLVGIKTLRLAELLGFFQVLETILLTDGRDLRQAPGVTFKKCHLCRLLMVVTRAADRCISRRRLLL